jgi:signal transduction histidine kinase/CheY-like chemotaxis protein
MNSREVLIVEDQKPFRDSIKRVLRADGYSFVEADSMAAGLKICKGRQSPSVILLDLKLPDGSGADFLERLGADIHKYKIIVLTAHEEMLAADLARKYDVFTYLPKANRISQPLRFTVSQAFKDIEREQLKDKNRILNKIQEQINSFQESTTSEETQVALKSVLKLICESVRELVGAYTAHIRVYNLQRGDFHLSAFAGPNDVIGSIFNIPKRRAEAFSARAAKKKRTLCYRNLQKTKSFQAFREDSLRRIGMLENEQLLNDAKEYFTTVQSAFISPITTRLFADEVDALFNVSGDSMDFFSPAKREIIMELVALATNAVTKAWQKLRKQEAHEDYQGINRVLEAISKELGGENAKPNIYDIVINGISQIIKPEAISLLLYNKSTGLLDNEAEFRGLERFEPSKKGHPTDEGLTALVYSTAKPLRVPNLQKGDRRKPQKHENASKNLYDDYVTLLPSGRVDHYLGVPMIIGNEVIGAIQLLNKKSAYYHDEDIDRDRWLLERGFSDDCENVLGIAASHLAVAIKNADLLEERRKQISQLAILKDVGRFTSSETLSELLGKIIREAAKVVEAEVCLLFLVDEETGKKVELTQRYGISEEDLPAASYEIGKGITGTVALTRRPYLREANVPDGKYDPEILRHLQKSYGKGKKIESLMIVPIQVRGELFGVIKVINKKGSNQHYDKDDLRFFEDFASYVGIAIDNTQRYAAAVKKLATAEGNSTLSNLVASTAHEINNSLGLVPAYLTSLRSLTSSVDNSLAIGEMLDRIGDVATQSVFYANEIGGYSIGKRGEQELLDINEIVRESLEQIPVFRKPDNFKLITVTTNLSPSRLQVRIHRTPLIQTIRNIIINAYQALDGFKAGRIGISTRKNPGTRMAIVEIVDNGCGIEPKYAEKVFEPEFTSKDGGSGIGLWLARRHLDAIGGRISFTDNEGGGTRFVLLIPLAESLAESDDE